MLERPVNTWVLPSEWDGGLLPTEQLLLLWLPSAHLSFLPALHGSLLGAEWWLWEGLHGGLLGQRLVVDHG